MTIYSIYLSHLKLKLEREIERWEHYKDVPTQDDKH